LNEPDLKDLKTLIEESLNIDEPKMLIVTAKGHPLPFRCYI
jgi:hypothetical protein